MMFRGSSLPLAALAAMALSACVSQPSGAASDEAAALRGRVYAEETCAQCHAVTIARLYSPNVSAPPFVELANTPGMTRVALNAWLHTSHPTMPNLIIEPGHIDDLSTYLATLKRRD